VDYTKGDPRPGEKLMTNIKFWGDKSKGLYLKFANMLIKKKDQSNKYMFEVKTPERAFEKYLDDMGVLTINIFDPVKNQTIGISKILLKLYLKRDKRLGDINPLVEIRG
jgi:hypothetical protein